MTPHITIDKNRIVKLAELPDPKEYPLFDLPDHHTDMLSRDGRSYNEAVKQAIASAPLFEDQERVKEYLPPQAFVSFYIQRDPRKLVERTYPLPPDFPKWEKVTQMEIMDQFVQMKWIDVTSDFPKMERNKDIDPTLFRTVIRFVEEKKEEVGGYPLDHTGSYFLCSKCAGTGKNPKMSTTVSASHPDCPSCHGRGWVTKSNYE